MEQASNTILEWLTAQEPAIAVPIVVLGVLYWLCWKRQRELDNQVTALHERIHQQDERLLAEMKKLLPILEEENRTRRQVADALERTRAFVEMAMRL